MALDGTYFAGFVESLWPAAEELSLPESFRVEADSVDAFLLGDIDFFGAATTPSDADFAQLLLGGGSAPPLAAPAAAAVHLPAPVVAPRPPPACAKPSPAPRRRAGSGPATPEKSRESGGVQKERRYWTEEERAKFHAAMREHGTDFAQISKFVGTRTSTQVRTHVQKYHLKLVREYQASKRKNAAAAAAAAAQQASTSSDSASAGM